MHLIENIRQKSITRHTMILLAAVTLSAAMATDALAAGHGGGGGHGGGFAGSHMGGLRGSFVNPVPSMPAPIFNSSIPYTVPQMRETPVSPASPGSVFGNG